MGPLRLALADDRLSEAEVVGLEREHFARQEGAVEAGVQREHHRGMERGAGEVVEVHRSNVVAQAAVEAAGRWKLEVAWMLGSAEHEEGVVVLARPSKSDGRLGRSAVAERVCVVSSVLEGVARALVYSPYRGSQYTISVISIDYSVALGPLTLSIPPC